MGWSNAVHLTDPRDVWVRVRAEITHLARRARYRFNKFEYLLNYWCGFSWNFNKISTFVSIWSGLVFGKTVWNRFFEPFKKRLKTGFLLKKTFFWPKNRLFWEKNVFLQKRFLTGPWIFRLENLLASGNFRLENVLISEFSVSEINTHAALLLATGASECEP